MSYSMKRQQKGLFRVYTRKEAEESYKKAIEGLTSVLYCEEDLARYLLHAFDAKTNKIHDAYFGDEERTKRKLGVLTEEEEKEAEKNNVLRLAMEEKEKKTEPVPVVARGGGEKNDNAFGKKIGKGSSCSRGTKADRDAGEVRNLLRGFSRG